MTARPSARGAINGPWSLKVGCGSHREVWVLDVDDRTVFYKYGSGTKAEANADEVRARLASSAPDLLAALKLILPLAKGYAPEGQTATARHTCNSWVIAAEEAIAKAEGGA